MQLTDLVEGVALDQQRDWNFCCCRMGNWSWYLPGVGCCWGLTPLNQVVGSLGFPIPKTPFISQLPEAMGAEEIRSKIVPKFMCTVCLTN